MIRFYSLPLFCATIFLHAASPTMQYLEKHPPSEIKYHWYLDSANFVHKELFDKIILNEKEGFIGYHGSSLEYRIYQDVIKAVIENIVGIKVPENFHFLCIPGFYNQRIGSLEDVAKSFLPKVYFNSKIEHQLFPIAPSLYANHNCFGYSPGMHFTTNTSYKPFQHHIDEIKRYFTALGIDHQLADELLALGKTLLKNDRGILLQIFDTTKLDFADAHCYAAFPNSAPRKNETVSNLYSNGQYPSEIRMLLTDTWTLNPNAPLVIKRFDKTQTSIVKEYNKQLVERICNANYDANLVEAYRNKLYQIWGKQ
ncbi:MAG: hypothetical protein KDK50_02120 [Chlamydiia bacterium]|nr:hypothetical protein [Chlamydiia bacterium]